MLLAVAAADSSSGGDGSGEVIGAVALRRLEGHTSTVQPGQLVAGVPLERVCEMKRLFVLAKHHGLGAGAALVRGRWAVWSARWPEQRAACLGWGDGGGKQCGYCALESSMPPC